MYSILNKKFEPFACTGALAHPSCPCPLTFLFEGVEHVEVVQAPTDSVPTTPAPPAPSPASSAAAAATAAASEIGARAA